MIVFQARMGAWGTGGWRRVTFGEWLFCVLFDRVCRVVVGSRAAVDELADPGWRWFDKRVRPEELVNVSMWDTRLNLL